MKKYGGILTCWEYIPRKGEVGWSTITNHFTKKYLIDRNFPSEYPDFEGGLIVRNSATVEHVVCIAISFWIIWLCLTKINLQCHSIHRSLVEEFRYALIWVNKHLSISMSQVSFLKPSIFQGTSTKHNPQRVGLSHVMENEDVIQGEEIALLIERK